MRTEIRYGKQFIKNYDKAGQKIQAAFKRRRLLFQKNPFHPQLHNHALTGRYKGCRSINVTGDWRAIYREREYKHGNIKRQVITFEAFGTHSQLYKR